MKRLTGNILNESRQEWDRAERQRKQITQTAWEADDRRYLQVMGAIHRFVAKFFRKQFEVFSKAAISAWADRGIITTDQAKAMSRSIEKRLDPEGG